MEGYSVNVALRFVVLGPPPYACLRRVRARLSSSAESALAIAPTWSLENRTARLLAIGFAFVPRGPRILPKFHVPGPISAGDVRHRANGAESRRITKQGNRALIKSIIAAIAFSLLAVSSASAFTPASSAVNSKMLAASSLIEAQYRPHRPHVSRRHVRRAPRYTPGRRYSAAPRGWHRYHARPGTWRNRGCIMVGPFWYCP